MQDNSLSIFYGKFTSLLLSKIISALAIRGGDIEVDTGKMGIAAKVISAATTELIGGAVEEGAQQRIKHKLKPISRIAKLPFLILLVHRAAFHLLQNEEVLKEIQNLTNPNDAKELAKKYVEKIENALKKGLHSQVTQQSYARLILPSSWGKIAKLLAKAADVTYRDLSDTLEFKEATFDVLLDEEKRYLPQQSTSNSAARGSNRKSDQTDVKKQIEELRRQLQQQEQHTQSMREQLELLASQQ